MWKIIKKDVDFLSTSEKCSNSYKNLKNFLKSYEIIHFKKLYIEIYTEIVSLSLRKII